jgi:citrate lyase subunit beta/citryl-CoA lyase
MTAFVRPRRSVLYMPGSNARALEKGRSLPADGLILDLEDALAPDAKREGRQGIAKALAVKASYGRRELIVRVNGLDTPWGHGDLSAMAGAGADAILLPKVEGSDTVRRALHVLDLAGAPPDLAIWCMIETPRGILRVEEIADTERVQCLVMGTSDLTKDLHAHHTPARMPMLASLEICLLAARAARISILDGVHLDLADERGFAEACLQGRELGFDGKTLIHPKQINDANAAFGPSDDEVAWARRIIEAYDAARAAGKGVAVVDGKLVENLHVLEARRLVTLAEAIAAARAEPQPASH